jgi:hypothetical protein
VTNLRFWGPRKEDVTSHSLRFLDMAVYSYVFNPIKSEGTAGTTRKLIRSYYEDPVDEYDASLAALQDLVQLGKEANLTNISLLSPVPVLT